jgi:hypothetical protein
MRIDRCRAPVGRKNASRRRPELRLCWRPYLADVKVIIRPSASTATRLIPFGLDISTVQGLAKAYAIGAGECLADAQRLQQELFSDRTGHYIITFHAIELGLKAFLIGKGYEEESLRSKPFGHNLGELLKAAKAKGLVLTTPHAGELIEWINEWHCDGVKIRYEFTEDRALPMCEVLLPLASEIIQKTALPESAIVDRVSPLNPNDTPFEVHSVGIRTNAFVYARCLVERDRKLSRPDRRYLIELKDGERMILSAEEVIARASAADLSSRGGL